MDYPIFQKKTRILILEFLSLMDYIDMVGPDKIKRKKYTFWDLVELLI